MTMQGAPIRTMQSAPSSRPSSVATETERKADLRASDDPTWGEYQVFFSDMQRSFPGPYGRALASLGVGMTAELRHYDRGTIANALVHQLLLEHAAAMLRASPDSIAELFGAQRDLLDPMVRENWQCEIFLLKPKEFAFSALATAHRAVFAKWALALMRATQKGMTNAFHEAAGSADAPFAGNNVVISKESTFSNESDLLLGRQDKSRTSAFDPSKLCEAAHQLYQKIEAVPDADRRRRLMNDILKSQYAR